MGRSLLKQYYHICLILAGTVCYFLSLFLYLLCSGKFSKFLRTSQHQFLHHLDLLRDSAICIILIDYNYFQMTLHKFSILGDSYFRLISPMAIKISKINIEVIEQDIEVKLPGNENKGTIVLLNF